MLLDSLPDPLPPRLPSGLVPGPTTCSVEQAGLPDSPRSLRCVHGLGNRGEFAEEPVECRYQATLPWPRGQSRPDHQARPAQEMERADLAATLLIVACAVAAGIYFSVPCLPE